MLSPYQEDQGTDLREYTAVLRRRKWTVILTTLLVVGGALLLSLGQTPVYRATGRVLVELVTPVQEAFGITANLDTEREVATSFPVGELARERLDSTLSVDALLGSLTVGPLPNTEVLEFAYSSTDPAFAQEAADAFAAAYLEFRREEVVQAAEEEREAIRERVDATSEELQALTLEIERARENGNQEALATLETEQTALTARLGVLQQRLEDAALDPAGEDNAGRVIEPATFPANPVSPNHRRSGVLGLVAGLLLGVGLAFVRERLDDRFRDEMDVERVLAAPTLASIPRFEAPKKSSKRDPSARHVEVLTNPASPSSEAFRALRGTLQYALSQRQGAKTVVITSPSEGEGKTASVANLAASFAQAGKRVIAVSADLRRPTLEAYFGLGRSAGLSTWLLGRHQSLRDVVLDTRVPNLAVLPAGPLPPNPAELLSSPRLRELVLSLEAVADLVLVDSPPLLPVADAPLLASCASGAVIIVDAEKTTRSSATRGRDLLVRSGAYVIGGILNGFNPRGSDYYKTYMGYHDAAPPLSNPAPHAPEPLGAHGTRRA